MSGSRSTATAPEWPVASFRLFASRLGRTGADYTTLAEWPLEPPER